MLGLKLKVILVLIPILLILAGISMLFKTHLKLGTHAGPYTVILYANGKIASQRHVKPGSDEESAIQGWIDSHQTGWVRSMKPYPSSHMIRGGNGFSLDFEPTMCVANFVDPQSGDSQQAVLSLTADSAPPIAFDH